MAFEQPFAGADLDARAGVGAVSAMEDIYGHDRVLDAALKQGYPYPVQSR